MKKRICVLLALITLAVIATMAGCSRVLVDPDVSGTVVYDYDGISFTEELSPEEVQTVAKVLNGKPIDFALGGTPACGFDYNVAIIINGRRYALACDSCGTVQDYGSFGYIHISLEERAALEEIFTSRGGTFPCI